MYRSRLRRLRPTRTHLVAALGPHLAAHTVVDMVPRTTTIAVVRLLVALPTTRTTAAAALLPVVTTTTLVTATLAALLAEAHRLLMMATVLLAATAKTPTEHRHPAVTMSPTAMATTAHLVRVARHEHMLDMRSALAAIGEYPFLFPSKLQSADILCQRFCSPRFNAYTVRSVLTIYLATKGRRAQNEHWKRLHFVSLEPVTSHGKSMR